MASARVVFCFTVPGPLVGFHHPALDPVPSCRDSRSSLSPLSSSSRSRVPAADDVPPNKQYLAFIRKQAAELRKNDKPPATARRVGEAGESTAQEPPRGLGRRLLPREALRPRPASSTASRSSATATASRRSSSRRGPASG